MTSGEILAVIGAISAFLGTVLIPGIVMIIRELKSQSNTLDKIHLLTNSANTTSLQLVVDSARKTAETTGKEDDFILLQSAEKALAGALSATDAIEHSNRSRSK